MFRNLEAELKRNDILREDVAAAIGVNIATVSAKLTTRGRLKLDEAMIIKEKFFPELNIDYLFDSPRDNAAV